MKKGRTVAGIGLIATMALALIPSHGASATGWRGVNKLAKEVVRSARGPQAKTTPQGALDTWAGKVTPGTRYTCPVCHTPHVRSYPGELVCPHCLHTAKRVEQVRQHAPRWAKIGPTRYVRADLLRILAPGTRLPPLPWPVVHVY